MTIGLLCPTADAILPVGELKVGLSDVELRCDRAGVDTSGGEWATAGDRTGLRGQVRP